MKRAWLLFAALILMSALTVTSCSDGTTLVSYQNGKKTVQIKIADVKKELMDYVPYRPDIAQDAAWHKDYLFRRHIALPAVYFDQISKGLTNSASYQSEYDLQYQKQYYFALYQQAQEAIKKEAQNKKYPVARVAHILFLVSRQTNDGKTNREMTDVEYAALLADKEAAAKNVIESLLVSKNQLRDFSNAAIAMSEDPGSKNRGGDVGYFSSDMMVKEFEDAAFAAKKKGLIATPVKTDYGIHIIYVIEPKKEMTVSQLKGKVKKEEFARLENALLGSYYRKVNESEVKEEYTLVSSNNTLVAQGVSYPLNAIADNAVIYTIYGKPFTWKDSVAVFKVMVPSMLNTNVTFAEFLTQMGNLKQFVPFIRYAEMKKLQNSSAFKKEMAEMGDKTAQQVAAQYFDKDMQSAIKAQITPAMIKSFYDSNKAAFMQDVNGKQVQQTLAQAEAQIKQQLESQLYDQYIQKWIEDMKVQMKVVYNEGGLKTLMAMEQRKVAEAQKKQEQAKKKAARANGGQQPQQPQQIQIPAGN